jgi:hypothetical protein
MMMQAFRELKRERVEGRVTVLEQVEIVGAEWEEGIGTVTNSSRTACRTASSAEHTEAEAETSAGAKKRCGFWQIYLDDGSGTIHADKIWLATGVYACALATRWCKCGVCGGCVWLCVVVWVFTDVCV